jgi:AraC-like DNA-binding protein
MRLVACRADPEGKWEVTDAVPSIRLRPGVRSYRGFRFAHCRPRRRLEVPVGVVTMTLNFDRGLRLATSGSDVGSMRPFTSLVAGLRTSATLGEHDGCLHGIEVNLEPWAAFTLFDTPLRELKNAIVEASDLLDVKVRELTCALAGTAGWARRFELLDHVLELWWAAGPVCSRRVVRAWQVLGRSGGTIPIARLAAAVDWSERQLERRFLEQIGHLPKAAGRIMRFRRALRMLVEGRPAVHVATVCGYYDQAHLDREFMAMTGRTISRFLLEHRAGRAGLPVLQRLADEVTSVPPMAVLPRPDRGTLVTGKTENWTTLDRRVGMPVNSAGVITS